MPDHDTRCPKHLTSKKKGDCICSLLSEARDEGHTLGYITAVDEFSWNCGDCGNTYGPDVDECPNALLDEMAMHRRARDLA